MTFTTEQKSQLAKLMATENLTVEHQKIRTARFDPKNRILQLPIWQDMTGFIYDHLVGHEVGHALYTPADGWHDAASDKSKGKNFKSFLNVVEDARIEKKVKRKYPGLNRSFRDSFAELMKRDFFGLNGREYSDLCFVDRLNLYTKSQYSLPIEFTADEQKMVNRVMAAETWDDVVAITGDIYDYSKDEQYEMKMQDFEQQSYNFSDDYDDYSDDYDYDTDEYGDDGESEINDSPKTNSKSQSEKSEEVDEENDGDGDGEETEKQSKSKAQNTDDAKGQDGKDNDNSHGDGSANRYKDSAPATHDMFQPECQTDDNFRANEVTLLDEKCKEYIYLTFPKPILKNIVTPAKRVQELLTNYYIHGLNPIPTEKVRAWVTEFKNKNDRYIGLLAKEFEMRKAAKAFSKSKMSDTGDIDINKLASYKFDDNIFRKVMLTPKGKSHGLVLLLDKSGSMSSNMAGSIEQILVLAMFCRKVNIPFVVYGFGDSIEANMEDLGVNQQDVIARREYQMSKRYSFERPVKSLSLETVFLREYINSKMSNAEFNAALRNMIILKKSYEGGRWNRVCGRPDSEHLSNTPLTQAIIASVEVMKTFKTSNNLDMTSLVIVHDGDSDWTNYYNVQRTDTNGNDYIAVEGIDSRNKNVIFRDVATKFEQKLEYSKNGDYLMNLALDFFRKATGSKVFGFFLLPDARPAWIRGTINHRYVLEDGQTYGQKYSEAQKTPEWWYVQNQINDKVKDLAKKFKEEKFLVSNTPGYNSFFLVAGGDELKTEEDELEIEGKVTSSKLTKAFMKMNKKKQISRVLVSKFIQGIAA